MEGVLDPLRIFLVFSLLLFRPLEAGRHPLDQPKALKVLLFSIFTGVVNFLFESVLECSQGAMRCFQVLRHLLEPGFGQLPGLGEFGLKLLPELVKPRL